MAASTTPTVEDLRAEIAEAQAAIAAAEREAGAAVLDGRSTAAAEKRAQQARARIERAQAAIVELEHREAAEAEERARGAASDARRLSYEWASAWAERAEQVIDARLALAAAEARLAEVAAQPGRGRIVSAAIGWHGVDAEASDLDAEVITGVARLAARKGVRYAPDRLTERATVDVARELRTLAGERAAEEASGRGVDRSGVPSTAALAGRARQAERRAAREQAREDRERERAERIAEQRAAAEPAPAQDLPAHPPENPEVQALVDAMSGD